MFLNPAVVIDKLDIRPGMKIADFGCGSGHFTIEMAKRAGSGGRVYAFDIQEVVLEALLGKIKLDSRLANIEIGRVDLEKDRSTGLSDGLLDFVLLSNTLFQFEDKEAAVKEAYRVLKPGGRAGLIEWSSDVSRDKIPGPPKSARIEKDKAKEIFTKIGFSFDREVDAGENHYGLVFRK